MPASSTGSGATPPSAPSSAPSGRPRGAAVALAIGAAAAASSWNPLGAPFALLAGAGAVVLGLAALRRGGSRRLPAAAIALGAVAAVASVLVLLASAGLGVHPEEQLGVEARAPAEMGRLLDEAAARTRDARERARKELGDLPPQPPDGPPATGQAPAPEGKGGGKRRPAR